MIELVTHAVPSADMSSYSSLLERKIKEIEHDPAEMRQVVYDVARLALKQQLYAQRPPLKSTDIQHSLSDLEAAIERVESQSAHSHRQATIDPLGEVRRDVAADKAVPTWRSEPTLSVELGDLVILPEGNAAAQGQPS